MVAENTAKLAHRAGFDSETEKCYVDGELLLVWPDGPSLQPSWDLDEVLVYAPTQEELHRWVRDRGLWIKMRRKKRKWRSYVVLIDYDCLGDTLSFRFKGYDYEKVMEMALRYALKMILPNKELAKKNL